MKKPRDNRLYIVAMFVCGVAILLSFLGLRMLLDGSINSIDKNNRLDVEIILKSKASSFWKEFCRGVDNAASEYNVVYEVVGPEHEEDYQTQIKMMNQAIDKGVDVIVLSAISSKDLSPSVEKAKKHGIKVVIADSGVDTTNIDAEIGTDNYIAGRMMGEFILSQQMENMHIGIVNFDKNSVNGQLREQGFRDVVENSTAVQFLKTINVDSNIKSAKAGTIELLQEYRGLNVLVTMNEWTTLGVGYAIKELELDRDVFAFGFDTNSFCLDMLESGYLDGLMVQNPFAIGYLSVESAQRLYNNEEIIPKRIDTQTNIISRENMYDVEIQKLIYPIK